MSDETNAFRNAAQNCSGYKKQLTALLALMNAAEAVGDIDQAVRDAEGRRSVAQRDADQAKARLGEIERKLDDARKAVKDQEAKAKELEDAGHKRRDEIVSEARREGERIVSASTKTKDAVEAEISGKRQTLREVEGELKEKRRELEETAAKIEAMKDQFKKALA